MEVGCNVGRNLKYLYDHGYVNLSGIEISEEAIKELKKSYPELAQNAELLHGSVEDVIRTKHDNEYDMIFTMAVLEHIHSDSDWILEEMVRVTSQYIMTIEAEDVSIYRFFKRNYRKVFEGLGMKQIYETTCEDAGLSEYVLRVFKKNY